MISGLTHVDGVINQSTKFKGKISTGFAPGEGPNKSKGPAAAGYFRVLKEITVNDRIGGQDVTRKEWRLNEPVQKILEESLDGSKTPRKLDFICLFQTPGQMWESSMAMYSGTAGLICRGHGEGTVAKELKKNDKGDRIWVDRPCEYKKCPDHISGKCKEIGMMKVFPLCDISTNPYRFETRSIYTIMGIEASLDKLWNLCKAAHVVRRMEAKKEISFEGMFGLTFSLIHRKVKGGGRDIYITDIVPTTETTAAIMEPLKRGIALNQAAALTVGGPSFSLLNANLDEPMLIEGPEEEGIIASLDTEDGAAIADQFGADADVKEDKEAAEALAKASAALLDQ